MIRKAFTSLLLLVNVTAALAGVTHANSYTPETSGEQPDIIVHSKLDSDWGQYLIDRIRILFKNNGVTDPFDMKIEEETGFTSTVYPSDLEEGQRKVFDSLARAFGIDLKKTKLKAVAKGIKYSIGHVIPIVKPDQAKKEYEADVTVSLSDVVVSTPRMEFALIVAPADGSEPFEWFKFAVIGPEVTFGTKQALDFNCRLKPEVAENLKFKVIESSFTKSADVLKAQPELVEIADGWQLEMDPVTFVAGGHRRTVEAETVREVVGKNIDIVKRLVVQQFAKNLEAGVGESLLKLVFEYPYYNDLWIPASIYTSLSSTKIYTSRWDHTGLELRGSFCSPDEFRKFGRECDKYNKPLEPLRKISDDQLFMSKMRMDHEVTVNKNNVVVSVSEHYINRLLQKTLEMGYWNDFNKDNIYIGPKGIFVILDEPTKDANLYIDLIYKLPVLERIGIGKKEIRFPLKLGVSMKIVDDISTGSNVPAMVFHLNEADLSYNSLVKGIPAYGLESNINKARFRKKIVKTVAAMVTPMINTEVMRILFPEMRDLGLETAEFSSDGYGRAVAKMKVGPKTLKDVKLRMLQPSRLNKLDIHSDRIRK